MVKNLRKILPEKYDDSQTAREAHSHGEDSIRGGIADAVVKADCLDDVVKTVGYCREHKIKLTAFGAGTSLEGHVVPLESGVALNLSGMNKIIEISEENMTARIMAGVTRQQLNHHLRDKGLFFSVDPGSEATIGGMAATGASGTNTVRYGTIKDNVRSLQVVMADGDVIETGTGAKKTSAGYDLTHLIIGSEGTLGIITELLVRLHPIPEYISVISCQFHDIAHAAQLVAEILQCGLVMARIELMDEKQIEASIAYSNLQGYDHKPTLLLELSGSQYSVLEQSDLLADMIEEHQGFNQKRADNEQERRQLWQARHDAFYSIKSFYADPSKPNLHVLVTDSCVPPNRLVETLIQVRALLDKTIFPAPIVGHLGDGNFHVQIMANADDADEMIAARKLVGQVSDIAINNGGTCTGEHGIGAGKISYLAKQHPDLIPWMKKIKQTFDPDNILNPGKIFN